MVRFGLWAVIVIVLAVSLQQAIALNCWNCDHQTPGCGDPFDKNRVPKNFNRTCTGFNVGSPVCVKVKFPATGFISRQCADNKEAAQLACRIGNEMAAVCELCETDRCNGATQYGPVAMMIISIPIAFLKLFSR